MRKNDYSGIRSGGRWLQSTGTAFAAAGILIIVGILVCGFLVYPLLAAWATGMD